MHKQILKIPVIGEILRKAAVARFTRTLSTTFAAGVPLIGALDSAAGASGNAVFRDAILFIKKEVAGGLQMNTAMRATGIFPDMVTQMIQTMLLSKHRRLLQVMLHGLYQQQMQQYQVML